MGLVYVGVSEYSTFKDESEALGGGVLTTECITSYAFLAEVGTEYARACS